jgi:hypothetical protein
MGGSINETCTLDNKGVVYWIMNENFIGFRKGWIIEQILGLIVFTIQFLIMTLSKFHRRTVAFVVIIGLCCATNILWIILYQLGIID